MLLYLTQICCTSISLYEQKLQIYSQPQLSTPVCIKKLHPTLPVVVREDIVYINGEDRIQLQFSVLLENFVNLVTRVGFLKMKKKTTPQETYDPANHKPTYIRIPLGNENILGFTVNISMFVEECSRNPRRIQHVAIMSPSISNLYWLKMVISNFFSLLDYKPHEDPNNYALQFCVIAENHNPVTGNEVVKHMYTKPFKVFLESDYNLKLTYVNLEDYHFGE